MRRDVRVGLLLGILACLAIALTAPTLVAIGVDAAIAFGMALGLATGLALGIPAGVVVYYEHRRRSRRDPDPAHALSRSYHGRVR